jgi:transposase InsO family protein
VLESDITGIPTWEGELYLAHVQDLFSRRIVGWAMAGHARKQLVIDALEMAVSDRRPANGAGASLRSRFAAGSAPRDAKRTEGGSCGAGGSW